MEEEKSQAEEYKKKIVEMINGIQDLKILIKIHTFVNTHLRLLKGED